MSVLSTITSDWTRMELGTTRIAEILRDLEEKGIVGEGLIPVKVHLAQWCRENIRGGFAVMAGGMSRAAGRPPHHAHIIMAFRRPDQAVKFKLTWS
jgi:hypothetical protein